MCLSHKLPSGETVIICGARSVKKVWCHCGRSGDFLCDWKVSGKKSGTCDRPICKGHALEVAPGKHLCQLHRRAYEDWKKRRTAKGSSIGEPLQTELKMSS